MQAFRFRLERVLQLRAKQLELEDARFKQAVAAVAELDRMMEHLRQSVKQAEGDLRQSTSLSGIELAALDSYRTGMRHRQEQLLAQRQQRQSMVEHQRAVMMEARRRCRLLDRLKERRRGEWQSACDREVEDAASESFLAGWARGQKLVDGP